MCTDKDSAHSAGVPAMSQTDQHPALALVRQGLPAVSLVCAVMGFVMHAEIGLALAPINTELQRVSVGVDFLKRQGYNSETRLDELSRRLDIVENRGGSPLMYGDNKKCLMQTTRQPVVKVSPPIL